MKYYNMSSENVVLAICAFNPELFKGEFDFIISNPPYITDDARSRRREGRTFHAAATADTTMVEQIFRSLPRLLSASGRALVMLSSTTGGWEQWVPSGFVSIDAADGADLWVPFDVEVVLDDVSWLDDLRAQGGIVERGDSYWHQLKPVWLMREK
jgi:methylase of polypeptide subunit release factors